VGHESVGSAPCWWWPLVACSGAAVASAPRASARRGAAPDPPSRREGGGSGRVGGSTKPLAPATAFAGARASRLLRLFPLVSPPFRPASAFFRRSSSTSSRVGLRRVPSPSLDHSWNW